EQVVEGATELGVTGAALKGGMGRGVRGTSAIASDPLESTSVNPGVTWVDEPAAMRPNAREYNSGAPGARSNLDTRQPQAPSIEGPDGPVRFDGETPGIMVDRKLGVVTTSKAQLQALRQSAALRQNGLSGMWEVPDAVQLRRANTMFTKLGIDNIQTRVV